MRLPLILLLAFPATATLAGCLGSKTELCGERVCPRGLVCALNGESCVLPDQLAACSGAQDGDGCSFPGGAGGAYWCQEGICVLAGRCGDGNIDPGEECDCGSGPGEPPDRCDGPNSNTEPDACRLDCRAAHCGDFVVDSGEVCDDGDEEPGDGCSQTCQSNETCGNGLLDDEARDEICDDGNNDSGDGCRGDCQSNETCGNGELDAVVGEQCDCGADQSTLASNCASPNGEATSGCRVDCTLMQCGNGELDPGEICDDGNTVAGDGCSGDCLSDETCGNAYVDLINDEECDCGTVQNPSPSCVPNGEPGSTCRVNCVIVRCGNGYLDGTETCDDGNLVAGDGCSPDCASDETCGNGYIDFGAGEQCDDGNLRSRDGCSSACTLELPLWREADTPFNNGRTHHGMAHDAGRGRTVIFGGVAGTNLQLADTWEFDGTGWRQLSPTTSPPGRRSPAMVYDSTRGRVVMFGGSGGGYLNDTWVFDGATWTDISPASAPRRQWLHTMAYDAGRDRIVQFSGFDGTDYLDETWEFDGTAWIQAAPALSPPARARAFLTYDSARGRVVLFGGWINSGGTYFSDTWEYDGVAWTETTPATSPSPRKDHRMVYDGGRNVVILFGGYYNGAFYADTWEYDGASWTQTTPVISPGTREQFGLAYDTGRGRTVIFGGWDGVTNLADTWEHNGVSWNQVTTVPSPPVRLLHAAAYDSVRGVLVLFGGFDGSTSLADTWEFGDGWLEAFPPFAPPARDGHAMTFDPGTERVILFGGNDVALNALGDTWEYDGTDWVETTPSPSPSARTRHAMTYDDVSQRSIAFGGLDDAGLPLDDTWEYDSWSEEWTSGGGAVRPPARYGHGLVYHPTLSSLFLFGGRAADFFDDTWRYDAVARIWTQVTTASTPPARADHGLAFDAVRDRLVLFAGSGDSILFDDTWEFDGLSWSLVPAVVSPDAQFGHAMDYHRERRNVVMVGIGFPQVETWEFGLESTVPDEGCADAQDDDGDGLVDCDDPDCRFAAVCQPAEDCTDGSDNDGDGQVDCQDPGCGGAPCGTGGAICFTGQCLCPTGNTEATCDDGADDDCDGLIDCADPDCVGDPYCDNGGICQSTSIQCGGSDSSTTVGEPANLSSYPCDPFSESGPEKFYRLDLTQDAIVTVTIDQLGADLDLVVTGSLAAGACDPIGQCIGASSVGGQTPESVTFVGQPNERYFFIVEGWGGAAGNYQISVTCDPCDVAEVSCDDGEDDDCNGLVDCADPQCAGDVACQVGICQPATGVGCGHSSSGSNIGGPSNITSYGCVGWTESGPEAYYRFASATTRPVTVTVSGLTDDLDLFVTAAPSGGCDPLGGCVDSSSFGGNTDEQVTFTAQAGQGYYIVVDGFNGSTSNFDLEVTCN